MTTQTKDLSILDRVTSPTPKHFKKIRRIGLLLGAVGAAIIAAPVSLPLIITKVAGYLITAGIVASSVSTTAVK